MDWQSVDGFRLYDQVADLWCELAAYIAIEYSMRLFHLNLDQLWSFRKGVLDL